MKLKKIILLVILILITGCSAEYTLVINDNETVDESLVVLQPNAFWSNSITEVDKQLDWILVFAEDETEPGYFYKHEKILDNTYSGVKYSYNFTYDNFLSYSEFIRKCFENYNVSFGSRMTHIEVSNFRCQNQLGDDFDFKINIQTNGTAIAGNYDNKISNTYIWNIKQNEDVNVRLTIDNSIKNQDEEKLSNNNSSKIVILVSFVIIILVILFVILLVAYNKNRRNND